MSSTTGTPYRTIHSRIYLLRFGPTVTKWHLTGAVTNIHTHRHILHDVPLYDIQCIGYTRLKHITQCSSILNTSTCLTVTGYPRYSCVCVCFVFAHRDPMSLRSDLFAQMTDSYICVSFRSHKYIRDIKMDRIMLPSR